MHWSGVFGSKISAEATWASRAATSPSRPYSGFGTPVLLAPRRALLQRRDVRRLRRSGPRTQANLAGSLYHELFGSAAQFKVGVDYQSLRSENDFRYPTNNVYYIAQYNPTLGRRQATASRVADPATAASRSATSGTSSPTRSPRPPAERSGASTRSRSSRSSRLSLNLGVRMDHQTSTSDLAQHGRRCDQRSPRGFRRVGRDGRRQDARVGRLRHATTSSSSRTSPTRSSPACRRRSTGTSTSGTAPQFVFDRSVSVGRQRPAGQHGPEPVLLGPVQHRRPAADRQHDGGRHPRHLQQVERPRGRRQDDR